jgi:ATP-dependent DNA helicase RecQ
LQKRGVHDMRGPLWERLRASVEAIARRRVRQPGSDCPEAQELRRRGDMHLHKMLGPKAAFRDGQWEAIEAVLRGERVLVVQRTGWGKSLVYFLATRLLREQGAGPTLLISPLLSLMRNQIAAAERIGVRALTINSDNRDEWSSVEASLERDECDVLLVSPERLGMGRFLDRILDRMGSHQVRRVGMLAIDEAHCISDWGHDFRPDYRRLSRIVRELPAGIAVLATTATANDRVVADVAGQLGPEMKVLRGGLARETLALHVVGPVDQAQRLAWLAEQLPRMPGSGIIYCLTVADCQRVSDWLLSQGIAAPPYHAALEQFRPEREALLIENRVKALVATVALGMGFDKPDLSFVIHFQQPASAVSYYQQVGRAGRAIAHATVVLMHGPEDGAVHEYFLAAAFPATDDMNSVVEALETAGRNRSGAGLTEYELLERVNVPPGRMEQILKLLEIDEAVVWRSGRYCRTRRAWTPDTARWNGVLDRRRHEWGRMASYPDHCGCRMEFLSRELGDVSASPCGRCDNCTGQRLPSVPSAQRVQEGRQFLQGEERVIEPRLTWPVDNPRGGSGQRLVPNEIGRALCLYGDGGWGRTILEGKYRDGRFDDALVEACAALVQDRWRPAPPPEWVTAVPSLRHPDLVPEFAARLAQRLGLPYHPVLAQVRSTAEQKMMANSVQQMRNILDAFQVDGKCPAGPVLLIDDVVDSRWTMTVAGHLIRAAGGGRVYPLALAEAAGRAGTA